MNARIRALARRSRVATAAQGRMRGPIMVVEYLCAA
jgi:hypothetical protein